VRTQERQAISRAPASGSSSPSPPDAPELAPELSGASGASLARLPDVAGAEYHPDGSMTVDFTRPPAETASEPTIAREGAPAHTAWTPASPSPDTPRARMAGAHRAEKGPDIDEIYNQVVERLTRDFLVERERNGDFLGDLP
jgi:hypothetical protein